MASLTVPYFCTVSHKLDDFRVVKSKHKMRVSIFSIILFETFLVVRTTQRDIVIYVPTSSSKVPDILVRY